MGTKSRGLHFLLQRGERRGRVLGFVWIAVGAAIVMALCGDGATQAFAQKQTAQSQSKIAGAAPNLTSNITPNVARGKYIVENVAMCGECHTPRDHNGNPDLARRLQGAAVPWQPATPDSNWPLLAPRIGGTPPANDADMIKLLTTGTWTDGKWLRFPMPQFRMEASDAAAVVAYLKSLTPQP